MPDDKRKELLLIETRGEAPLVCTLRDFDEYPQNTLGCVVGVDGPFLLVRLAGSDEPTRMLAREVKGI